MKTIQLKSMHLLNFKGIRNLEINNLDEEVHIFGANGSGKTSLFDAFTWVLFGKDSQGRTSFEVKTLDNQNNVIEKIDHKVTLLLLIDGEETEIKRILREKWVTKRGSVDAEFSGNETIYFWDEVPTSAGDFNKKVAEILQEDVFKIITNPLAFNALKWQDRREKLLALEGGDISLEKVAAGNEEFEALLAKMGKKSLADYEAKVKASLKNLVKLNKEVPTRIDEVNRNLPEALDWEAIAKEIQNKQDELTEIDSQINDKSKASESLNEQRNVLTNKINDLDLKINKIKHELRKEAQSMASEGEPQSAKLLKQLNDKGSELKNAEKALETYQSRLKSKEDQIVNANKALQELHKAYDNKIAEEIDLSGEDTKCPTCHREFEPETLDQKRQEVTSRFNKNKEREIQRINGEGKAQKDLLKSLEAEKVDIENRIQKGHNIVAELTTSVTELEASIEDAKASEKEVKSETQIYSELLSDNTEIESFTHQMRELEFKRNDIKSVDLSDLKAKKEPIQKSIDELKASLSVKDQIVKGNARAKEIKKEGKQYAQQIADIKRDLHTIEQLTKAKIERLEESINDRFEIVNFKMFNTQINGAITETCEALIDGVPFSDANTASKINGGLDIINTLCEFYAVSAPVFVDNRESVIEIIDMESQIINLVVAGMPLQQVSNEFAKEYLSAPPAVRKSMAEGDPDSKIYYPIMGQIDE